MERFKCVNGSDNLQIPAPLLEELSVTEPAELHLQPDIIADVCRRMQTGGWVRLPFCNTLCGEALGAQPVLSLSGARVKEPVFQKADQLPAELNPDTPRLAAMLQTVECLKAEGKCVAYNVEGPFTVLCALLPMNRVFSALRKSTGGDLLQMAENWISSYTDLAVKRGAALISFADPVATIDILGERMFTTVYLPCLKRLLLRLRAEHPHVPIHLCGKLTQCLLDIETCTVEKWEAKDAMTYAQALTAFCQSGHGGIIGHFCLNFLDAKRPYLKLVEFK